MYCGQLLALLLLAVCKLSHWNFLDLLPELLLLTLSILVLLHSPLQLRHVTLYLRHVRLHLAVLIYTSTIVTDASASSIFLLFYTVASTSAMLCRSLDHIVTLPWHLWYSVRFRQQTCDSVHLAQSHAGTMQAPSHTRVDASRAITNSHEPVHFRGADAPMRQACVLAMEKVA